MSPSATNNNEDPTAPVPKLTTASQSPLLIKKLSPRATTPTRGSAFAAGYDIYSAYDTVIPARGKALVDTELAIAVPEGTCTLFPSKDLLEGKLWSMLTNSIFWFNTDGRIAPRSGLASKHFIDTGAGVIDADYRGQVKVLLFNHAEVEYKVKEGERVAQLVLERVGCPKKSGMVSRVEAANLC
jgi:dUTP pyrophosphatase